MALSKATGITLAIIFACITSSVNAQERHALIIGGLGGAPEQTSRIASHLEKTYNAFIGPLGFEEEHVTVLGERTLIGSAYIHGESTAENIRAHFLELSEELTPEHELYILLFGHGSYDGEQSALNIPRRDLSGSDYAALIHDLQVRRSIWICTMSASGPFIQALSAPERIVITATRTGTQRNQTIFPEHLTEALVDPAADLDRDANLSLREVFQYTAEETARHYEREGHLATEHSLLDDNGDREGTRADMLDESNDGFVASVIWLRRSQTLPEAPVLVRERTTLEGQIALLKARKNELDIDAYYAELETLFIALARLNEHIEE